jgi:hypothetical protein
MIERTTIYLMPELHRALKVISCAERNGGRVLTLDLRQFGVVADEGNVSLLP